MDNFSNSITIDVVLDEGAYLPEKAHDADAGFDLRSRTTEGIQPGGSVFFDTGVRVAIPKGYVGFLKSKSGLNVKYGLTGTGVIDSGYTGTIGVKLYNNSDDVYIVKQGDKLIQIVFLPIPDVKLNLVDSLEKTDRGDGGFGSTGK